MELFPLYYQQFIILTYTHKNADVLSRNFNNQLEKSTNSDWGVNIKVRVCPSLHKHCSINILTLLCHYKGIDIFEASERGDVGRIEELVKSGISVNSRRADWTPLIIAAIYNQVEAAQFLYDNGCDLNYQDDGGYTALH